jgi:hypothetical protein
VGAGRRKSLNLIEEPSMKRCALGLLLFACATLVSAFEAEAAQRRYPPRYTRGSFVEYRTIVRNGQPQVQKTYNGYSAQFPTPAFLFYGYPHSYDATGIGF